MPPDLVRLADNLELDRRAYELRRLGNPVKLSRIPMELLLLLVERRGELVTRDEIGERIWGSDVFVDRDNNINAAIRKLRQVLDDDPEHPKFVQTITGRGYRFIATTPEVAGSVPALAPISEPFAAGEQAIPQGAVPATLRGTSAMRLRPVLLTLLSVLMVAVGVYFQWFRSSAHPQAAAGRLMLAVLPFENLTGDGAQDYFSDGLTEEMISQLGNLNPQHLGVIARTSVMHYKGSQEPLKNVGLELGVQYVLEGSVRRDSGKVRISAQLIQVKDRTHLWARQYDRELVDLLTLQREIAREIAGEIQLTLGGEKNSVLASQSQPSQTSYEAYDLYLRGRYFWNKRTSEGFQQAIRYFQQAISKDPNYARAYAGLADSYAMISSYNLGPKTEFMPKARAAALKALELDEGLAEAHTSLALVTENYDWNWQAAEKEYRRAIELNPNYATAHHWYAECLTWEGRFDEALRESERARQLDPLSLIIAADNGMIYYYSRRYDLAVEKLNAVLEMEPNFPRAHLVRAAYVEKGQFADALADIENYHPQYDNEWYWSSLAYVYGRSGRPNEARRLLEKLERLNQHTQVDPATILMAHLGLGSRDQAFFWLERAYAEHSNAITTMKVEPAFDLLRSDPRFQDLQHRVGLAQ